MFKETALVLAGGVGSRFHPYTEIIPKSMIPIGPNEKPVLEIILKWLNKYGVDRFVFLVDYKWRYIYNYFGDGSRFKTTIMYSHDDQQGYKGTGGSILKAYRTNLVRGRSLIWYGDIIAPLDVKNLLDYHVDKKSDVTLVITRKYQVPVGVAQVDEDGRIVNMVEKPELDISATIGVGVIEEHVFHNDVESHLGKDFDFMGDFIPWLIKRGFRVYGYVYQGPWFDVGSLERYKKININQLEVLKEVLYD